MIPRTIDGVVRSDMGVMRAFAPAERWMLRAWHFLLGDRIEVAISRIEGRATAVV